MAGRITVGEMSRSAAGRRDAGRARRVDDRTRGAARCRPTITVCHRQRCRRDAASRNDVWYPAFEGMNSGEGPADRRV